jgi:hypothetical protein
MSVVDPQVWEQAQKERLMRMRMRIQRAAMLVFLCAAAFKAGACLSPPGVECGNGWCAEGYFCVPFDSTPTCIQQMLCGNSMLDPGEECDSGGMNTSDCTSDCQKMPWQLIATIPDIKLDPLRYGFSAVGFDSRIFFGPETNYAPSKYWRSVDVSTGTLSAPLSLPAEPNDFCACGASQRMIATPPGIYMLGNYGLMYSPTSTIWSGIPSYASWQRPGAAATYVDSNNTILLVGGGNYNDTALRYNLADNTIHPEGDRLPFGIGSAVAYAQLGDERIYVAVERASDGNSRHLIAYTPSSGRWTLLPDAPVDLYDVSIGHTSIKGVTYLSVSSHYGLYLFNIEANTWEPELPLPAGDAAQTIMVNGSLYLMIQNGFDAEIYNFLPAE